MKFATFSCILLGLLALGTASIVYEPGFVYEYDLSTEVHHIGQISADASKKSSFFITCHVELTCLAVDANTGSSNLKLFVSDIVVRKAEDASPVPSRENLDSFFETPAYFTHTASGHIEDVMLPISDTVFVDHLYKAILSALNVRLETGLHSIEDNVGRHTAQYSVSKDPVSGQVTSQSSFNQDSFQSFPDPNAHTSKLAFVGQTEHNIGGESAPQVIHFASVSHEMRMLNPNQYATSSSSAEGQFTDSSVASITTTGSLTMTWNNRRRPGILGAALDLSSHQKVSLINSVTSMRSRKFDRAAEQFETMNIIKELLADPSNMAIAHKLAVRIMEAPEEVMYVEQALSSEHNKASRRSLLFAMSMSEDVKVQRALLRHGIQSPIASERTQSALYASRIKNRMSILDKEIVERGLSITEPTEALPSHMRAGTDDSLFPNNRQGSFDKTMGPSDLSLDISASYFAGTNFEFCSGGQQSKDLNYKIAAGLDVKVDVFGFHKDVANVDAAYVAEAGATTDNHFRISLFGHTIKDTTLLPFSTTACPPENVIDIWHATPGWSVSYTVTVVVIPVTFSVGVSAQLDVSLGYGICIQDLKAIADLRPSVTVTASASASASVLVAKGGVEVSGSVNEQLRPAVWVNLNECAIGANVHHIANPADVSFNGYYQTRTLSWHHWRPRISWSNQHQKTFWSWHNSYVDEGLFGEKCALLDGSVSCIPYTATDY
eukprot:ANDGO_07550.mRNA.1 lipid transport family protein